MHVPLEIVQANVLTPTDKFETEVVGDDASEKFPQPETTVQIPVPTTGIFPSKDVVVEQIVWSLPAAEIVGATSTVIETSSKASVHDPPEIVQRNVFTPIERLETVEFANAGFAIIPVPEITVHEPPETAVAFKVELVAQIV